MDVYTLFLLSLITLSSMRAMKIMRKEMLYNKVANMALIYVSEIVGFAIFQGLMFGLLFNLSEQFSKGHIVSACYMHILINVVVQLILLKKEDQGSSNSRYDYLKWIWMIGVALYSVLFIIALQNLENLFVWVIGTGIAHALYNLGYFFFLYFTERELMQMESHTEDVKPNINLEVKLNPTFSPTLDMAECVKPNVRPDIEPDMRVNMKSDIEPRIKANGKHDVTPDIKVNVKLDAESCMKPDMESNGKLSLSPDMRSYTNSNRALDKVSARKLVPIHKMYGEDYRKLKLEEVRARNTAALLMFCILVGVLIVHVVLLLWGLGVPMATQMTFFLICLFMAGVAYLTYCRMKAERNVKTMQIETVYEGIAQVVAYPLTVRYLLPDGSMVVGQDFSRQKNTFPIGSYVKIMVKNGVIVKSVKESESFLDVYQNMLDMDMPMKGKRLDKEMAKAVRVALLIMIIGMLGGGYCLVRYPEAMTPEVKEEEKEPPKSVSPGYLIQRMDLEEEISNCLEEKMAALLRQQFPEIEDADLVSIKEICTEKAKSIQSLACYEVLKTETQDYERYIVKIEVTPTNVFQTLRTSFEEVSHEKEGSETYENALQTYADIVEESIQQSIEQNTYGEEYVMEMTVTVSDNECELDESERKRMFMAIFPQ